MGQVVFEIRHFFPANIFTVTTHTHLHLNTVVSRKYVEAEKPFTRSPQFWTFSSHILSQSPQNLQVKFLIDSLSRRNEFPVHDSSNIEKNNEHLFHIWPHLSCFFRSRWSGLLPLAQSLFGLRVVPIAPTFVARDDVRKKVWVTFNLIFQLLAQVKRVFFGPVWAGGEQTLRQRVSCSNPRSKSAERNSNSHL